MLSPHDLATRPLVDDARDQAELNRVDLVALFEQQFTAFDKLSCERQNLHLTKNGRAIVKVVTQIRKMTDTRRGQGHD